VTSKIVFFGLKTALFGLWRRFINVITARNGFIIVTLLALSGAKSVVGSHRLAVTPLAKQDAVLSSPTKAD
jgi:predicted transporter